MHRAGFVTLSANARKSDGALEAFFYGQKKMRSIYECEPVTQAEDWKEYSRRKSEWVKQNPHATPEEYDAAIRAIVDDLGV